MSYEKPFLTTSDHAVGLQCVNRALENNRALYSDQFDPGHSAGVGGLAYGDPFLTPGKHDDPLVARTAADFAIDATGLIAVELTTGLMVFGPPTKLKTGQWQILISTPRIFNAYAIIKGPTAGVARYATCFVSSDVDGPSVTVSTWNAAGGVLADYDFSLVIYAEAVA
jgi:hypothetical protein